MRIDIREFKRFSSEISKKRHKVGLIVTPPRSEYLTIGSEIAEQVDDFQLIDALADLSLDMSIPLGAYSSHNLIRDIESIATEETCNLLITNLEPIVATFAEDEVDAFFKSYFRMEPKTPVILITYLKSTSFPKESTQIIMI